MDSISEEHDYTESFGEFLKRHREASGKTLDEICRVTRISRRYLEAFEMNQVDNFPDEAFARGFLKNYAHEIGLDADECSRRYDQLLRSRMPTQIKDLRRADGNSVFLGEDAKTGSSLVGMILAAVVVVGTLVAGFVYYQNDQEDPAEVSSATELESVENSDSLGFPDTAEKSNLTPSVLKVSALSRINLVVRIDETAAQEVVIEAGETKSFDVFRQIEIRDIDEKKLTMLYNDKPIEISGDVIKLFNRNMFVE